MCLNKFQLRLKSVQSVADCSDLKSEIEGEAHFIVNTLKTPTQMLDFDSLTWLEPTFFLGF